MKIWKKNMVAAAILVTVCAGIYVNWLYSEDQATVNLEDTLNEEKIMSEDSLVMSNSAVGLLQEAMAYSDSAEAAQTNTQLEKIVQTALCEAQIESLIIAKGYSECVAYISEEGISVAVASPEGGLQENDVAVIADIVLTQSQYDMNDIRVVEVQ